MFVAILMVSSGDFLLKLKSQSVVSLCLGLS